MVTEWLFQYTEKPRLYREGEGRERERERERKKEGRERGEREREKEERGRGKEGRVSTKRRIQPFPLLIPLHAFTAAPGQAMYSVLQCSTRTVPSIGLKVRLAVQ